MGRAQAVFTVLALLVVCSLIAGTVGAAVVDEINRRNADDLTSVPEASEDVFESELRDDIEQNPEDVDSMAALGNYLAQTGRLDEGIGWYEKALGIAPTNSAIRLDFARDLAGGDKRQDAELQFKRVLEGQPDDPTVHFELAQLYAAWVPPRTSEAIAEYQRVVAAGQDSFITERAKEELRLLGVTASPIAGSPVPAQPTLEPTP